MKNLKKDDIKRRFSGHDLESLVSLEMIRPFSKHGVRFSKKLIITIPGHPITDSRPRFKAGDDGFSHAYNPHKANLMKIFGEIYNNSETLNGLTILSPSIIEIDYYLKIPNDIKKLLKPKELDLLSSDGLYSISKKDNDNIEKVHFDVSQDFKYQILLRDETIVENNTQKFFVDDAKKEKVVITYTFGDLPYWMKPQLEASTEYLKHIISLKYKLINEISDEKWGREFYKNIAIWYKKNKGPIKRVKSNLEYMLNTHYKKTDLVMLDPTRKVENIISNVEKMLGGIK